MDIIRLICNFLPPLGVFLAMSLGTDFLDKCPLNASRFIFWVVHAVWICYLKK